MGALPHSRPASSGNSEAVSVLQFSLHYLVEESGSTRKFTTEDDLLCNHAVFRGDRIYWAHSVR